MWPKKPARHTLGILTGRKKTSFSHFCISVIPYPIGTKFATELPASQESLYLPNLKEIAPAISEIRAAKVLIFFSFFLSIFLLRVFAYLQKLQTRTPIVLKFGTQKGSPKANPNIKCGANSMNGSGVITDYSRKTRSICCHAYTTG